MTSFDQNRISILLAKNRVCLYFFGVLVDSIGGVRLINMFLRVYFDVFRQSSRFNFRPSKQSLRLTVFDKIQFEIFTHKTEFVLYVFGFSVDSIGGTSYKRVHGVLF